MSLALKEARKGRGKTSPNPCVGAVIVDGDQIIATGYHKKAGTPHAEIHALRQAGENAAGATMYVTLEPCSHTGKTPPCCEAVAAAGISKVVVGMQDPNPLVSGNGTRYLQQKGIEVIGPVLEQQCRAINRPFIKHITCGTPWVIMKAGVSLDGRLTYQKGNSGWITGPESKRRVHLLRHQVDAIMVGRGTVTIDDPSLTTRLAGRRGKDPLRVIVDTGLRISPDAKVLHLTSSAPTWIFCGPGVSAEKVASLTTSGVVVHQVSVDVQGQVNLTEVLSVLGAAQITSLLVEGGGALHGSLLRQKLVDHVNLFLAPLFAGDSGIPLVTGLDVAGREQALRIAAPRYRRVGEDMMISGDILQNKE